MRAPPRGRPRSRRSRRAAPWCSTVQPISSRATSSTGRSVETGASASSSAVRRRAPSCSTTRASDGAALGDLRLEPGALLEHSWNSTACSARMALWAASSPGESSDRRLPRLERRCAPGRRRCRGPRGRASRRTSRSATSVAAISSSEAASRRRSRRSRRPRSCPAAAASDSSSVSTASNRCSLSSCRSLL